MKNRKFNYILFIPITLAFILIAFGGGQPNTITAEVNVACYSVYLPMIIGSGNGGGGAPGAPANCPGSEQFADFNGDGFSDLAVGSPSEWILFNGAYEENAGAINVIYGSPSGLSSDNNQLWTRKTPGIPGDPEEWERFGAELEFGDFNTDGYDDLAIGIGSATVSGEDRAGEVLILFGSSSGLTANGYLVLSQATTGISDIPESDEGFGGRLETGDYNGDGYIDLAISAPGESAAGAYGAGAVHILYGQYGGFQTNDEFIHQGVNGSSSMPFEIESFGSALSSGDFNNDGFDDLAVGTPSEDVVTQTGTYFNAGAVQIFYGANYGLVEPSTNSVNEALWHTESNSYVPDVLEDHDRFGYRVEAGDFNGDGYSDLAASTPNETHETGGGDIANAGVIHIFYGSSVGLDATAEMPAYMYSQDTPGMQDNPEADEKFGYSLQAADFNNDGYSDLAIGVPWETNFSGEISGAVAVMLGNAIGLVTADSNLIQENGANSEPDEEFGFSLTVGDYNADGNTDLVVGIPNDNPIDSVSSNIGSVWVGYGNGGSYPGSVWREVWHRDTPGILGTPFFSGRFGSSVR